MIIIQPGHTQHSPVEDSVLAGFIVSLAGTLGCSGTVSLAKTTEVEARVIIEARVKTDSESALFFMFVSSLWVNYVPIKQQAGRNFLMKT